MHGNGCQSRSVYRAFVIVLAGCGPLLQCYNRPYAGATVPVSPFMVAVARGLQATGTFQIGLSTDAWFAHQHEAAKFLKAVSRADNVVQYGGDSHADWAGVQRVNNKVQPCGPRASVQLPN